MGFSNNILSYANQFIQLQFIFFNTVFFIVILVMEDSIVQELLSGFTDVHCVIEWASSLNLLDHPLVTDYISSLQTVTSLPINTQDVWQMFETMVPNVETDVDTEILSCIHQQLPQINSNNSQTSTMSTQPLDLSFDLSDDDFIQLCEPISKRPRVKSPHIDPTLDAQSVNSLTSSQQFFHIDNSQTLGRDVSQNLYLHHNISQSNNSFSQTLDLHLDD